MTEALAVVPAPSIELRGIALLVLDSVRSPQSKRAYHKALADFLAWRLAIGYRVFNKAIVQQYRAELEKRGLSPATINLRLTGIRRLAAEAADNGLLDPLLAAGISRIRGPKSRGVRIGRWLTRAQAEELVSLPGVNSKKGKRDRLILGLLLGCGLRRAELVSLQFGDVQQRDGRWVVANLVGKGERLRTVPMPAWAKVLLDHWSAATGLENGPVLRAINKSDRVLSSSITAQSVFNIVKGYAVDLGVDIAPHDLRRTFAHLAHRGHAALEQIQLSLGHASIVTTERYLGIQQDLADAPCDHLGLKINPA